jgi:ABC-type polysaccharide/polyol phosphate transport system ATPase subunit
MSDTVISVENLSKSYLVGHKSSDQGYKRYTALRDVLGDEVRNFARNAVNIIRGRQVVLGDQVEEFWALKDVSFEVKRGEVLGIIGRNGAGKSTLLKILSRITEPTRGRVLIRGRVASLLEVGTGFHAELTGRENIYLNGAILGMTRTEIRRKFDEIVAFAEVEKFLDTPVKRYSSGMYVRLAFAVAAHLEPEILIVDEVLAVGDAEFQQKCLGKMQDVSRGEGRTVLFVSHSLPAILNLCTAAMFLMDGAVAQIGDPLPVCGNYATFRATRPGRSLGSILQNISLLNHLETPVTSLSQDQYLKFEIVLNNLPEDKCMMSLLIRDMRNAVLFELFDHTFSPPKIDNGDVIVEVNAGLLPLLPGVYSVDVWIGNRMSHRIEFIDNAIEFEVVAAVTPRTSIPLQGSFYYASNWRLR